MHEFLHTPLVILHVVACLFLILVVLLQPGKSGGLGAFTGATAQQVFGGRGAGNFLTKITWGTATTFFLTSLTLAYLSSSADESLLKRAKAAPTRQVPSPRKPARAGAPPLHSSNPAIPAKPSPPTEPAKPAGS